MKRKFISIWMVGLLLAVMLVGLFALPVAATEVDVGTALSADHAVVGSEAALVTFDVSAPAPAPVITLSPAPAPAPASQINEWSVWVALSAILLVTAIACRRNLLKMLTNIKGSRSLSDGPPEGTKAAGGPRDGILPAAV